MHDRHISKAIDTSSTQTIKDIARQLRDSFCWSKITWNNVYFNLQFNYDFTRIVAYYYGKEFCPILGRMELIWNVISIGGNDLFLNEEYQWFINAQEALLYVHFYNWNFPSIKLTFLNRIRSNEDGPELFSMLVYCKRIQIIEKKSLCRNYSRYFTQINNVVNILGRN